MVKMHCLLYAVIFLFLASRHIVNPALMRAWTIDKPVTDCDKEKLVIPDLYIQRMHGFAILKKCYGGSLFSDVACGCVIAIPYQDTMTLPPRILLKAQSDKPLEMPFDEYCPAYFRFIFDQTTTSVGKMIPSSKTTSVQYAKIPGSTGETSAFFGGDGIITIWSMSYITFAAKFKFVFRFKLLANYQYEDKNYALFGDGPCRDYKSSKYSVFMNPVKREIYAKLNLRNKSNFNLTVTGVNFDTWVLVELEAKTGEVTLNVQERKATNYIGASTIKSSPCPLEIGKSSDIAGSFIGYVDKIEFYNCFNRR